MSLELQSQENAIFSAICLKKVKNIFCFTQPKCICQAMFDDVAKRESA